MRSDLQGGIRRSEDQETKKRPLPPGQAERRGVKNARTGFYRQTAGLPKCCAQAMRRRIRCGVWGAGVGWLATEAGGRAARYRTTPAR
ncbi:membrane protein [Ralstonia solanacearum]|nr:membrane protein [Ralstonia solanacearum]